MTRFLMTAAAAAILTTPVYAQSIQDADADDTLVIREHLNDEDNSNDGVVTAGSDGITPEAAEIACDEISADDSNNMAVDCTEAGLLMNEGTVVAEERLEDLADDGNSTNN